MPSKKRRYKKTSTRRRVKSRPTSQNINKINIRVSPGGGGGGGGIISMPNNQPDIAAIIRSLGFIRKDETSGGVFTTQNDPNQQALVQRRSQEYGNSDHPHAVRIMQSSFTQTNPTTEASTDVPNFDQDDLPTRAAKNDYPSSNIWTNLITGLGTWLQAPNAVEKEMNPMEQSITKSAIKEKLTPKTIPSETDLSVNKQIRGNQILEGPDVSAITNFWGNDTLMAESANPDAMLKSQIFDISPIKPQALDQNFDETMKSSNTTNGYVEGTIPGSEETVTRSAVKRILEKSKSDDISFGDIYPNALDDLPERYTIPTPLKNKLGLGGYKRSQRDKEDAYFRMVNQKNYDDFDNFSNMQSKASNNEIMEGPILMKNTTTLNPVSGSRRTRKGTVYGKVAF